MSSRDVRTFCKPTEDGHKLLERAIDKLSGVTRLNLHIIISDRDSIDEFFHLRSLLSGPVEYFVLLPYQPVGFAKPVDTDFEYLFDALEEMETEPDYTIDWSYLIGTYEYDWERPNDPKASASD